MEKKVLPNATTVLVLGILSIALCWCFGIVGIVLGIISLFLSSQSTRIYYSEPDTEWIGYDNLKAGRICSIIGLCLSVLFLVYMVWYYNFIGSEEFRSIMEEYTGRSI